MDIRDGHSGSSPKSANWLNNHVARRTSVPSRQHVILNTGRVGEASAMVKSRTSWSWSRPHFQFSVRLLPEYSVHALLDRWYLDESTDRACCLQQCPRNLEVCMNSFRIMNHHEIFARSPTDARLLIPSQGDVMMRNGRRWLATMPMI